MPGALQVIVVTYRRKDWCLRCLQSLFAAKGPRELHVQLGINGRDPETYEAVVQWLEEQKLSTHVTVHHLAQPGNPGEIRNQLMSGRSGDWFFFVDDDAFVEKDHFEKFDALVKRFPDASVIGGPNLTPPKSSEFQRLLGVTLSSRLATFKTADRYKKTGEPRYSGENSLILCNLFIRADLLKKHRFPAGFRCGEENFLLSEVSAEGAKLLHAPELYVWHERRSALRDLALQVYHYGKGRAQGIELSRLKLSQLPYLLPSLCLVMTAAYLIAEAFGFSFFPFYEILFVTYLALCLKVAFSQNDISNDQKFMVCLLFMTIHLFYGVGILAGLFSNFRFKPQKKPQPLTRQVS